MRLRAGNGLVLVHHAGELVLESLIASSKEFVHYLRSLPGGLIGMINLSGIAGSELRLPPLLHYSTTNNQLRETDSAPH